MLSEEEKYTIRQVLENDGVIAFVTDTVWGIGCIPQSKKAVEKIYKIKNRDLKKPLILMSYEIYPLLKYLKPLCKRAHQLIKKHFPGALTLVVEKSELTADYITSGLDTVGIRLPDNSVFQQICKCAPDGVLATTSANISDMPPALNYEQALEYVGDKVDYIVKDHGLTSNGTASTVAGISDEKITVFRQGEIRLD